MIDQRGLGHKAVQHMFRNFMWHEKGLRTCKRRKLYLKARTDEAFADGNRTILAELKPEYASATALATGIGQVMLAFRFEEADPYLVIPEKFENAVKPVAKYLPCGIIFFDKAGRFRIYQEPTRTPCRNF